LMGRVGGLFAQVEGFGGLVGIVGHVVPEILELVSRGPSIWRASRQ
jgi:hypothetical protein